MTQRLENMTEIFEIELLDHFIVGKEKTLSFSKDVGGFKSHNSNYQDKIEGASLVKEANDNYLENNFHKKEGSIIDEINKMIDEDYEGFVKALITIENGIEDPKLLDELYEKFMQNDGVNLINNYFDELIYDLDYDVTRDREKSIESTQIPSKEKELFNKIDGFVEAYTDLSNAMYDIDYDFGEAYPLEKSFHDIDFIGWAEASKQNISEGSKEKNLGKINPVKDKNDSKKESTIEKLNKLKDKVAKYSGDKLQDKLGDKKKDREI